MEIIYFQINRFLLLKYSNSTPPVCRYLLTNSICFSLFLYIQSDLTFYNFLCVQTYLYSHCSHNKNKPTPGKPAVSSV